jgi:hypothetical protein
VVPDWFPFFISCKNNEKWDLNTFFTGNGGIIMEWWVEHCRACERTGRSPMLMFTRNYAPLLLMVPGWASVQRAVVLKTTECITVCLLLDWLAEKRRWEFE